MTTKAKVYKDIICLEVASPEGGKWWFQTPSLSYTPYHVDRIQRLVWGKMTGSSREVLAVPVQKGAQEVLVAVNLPRSDLAALKRRKLIPAGYPVPDRENAYTPWPDHAQERLSAQQKAAKNLY
ncbi:MAG: hypothetical protein GC134_04620 [Proteobacteria bacterium]|nr:hypothetical protein [Pseudomonadota bacterium]